MEHGVLSTSPSVSVIVPTVSRPELLRTAVRSILEQDYPGPVEVVVVHDHSEPDTALAEEFELTGHGGARTLRVITNSRRQGLAGTRNSGVLESSGDLIAFCDDDDRWHPEKLSAQVRALTGANAGLAVCGIVIEVGSQRHERVPTAEDVTLHEVARRRVMEAHPSTVLVRRDGFERIGWVDEDLPGGYAEDWDWMLRALATEPVAVVSRPLVTVLWHPGSYFTSRWLTIIEALDYMIDKHAPLRESRRGLARIYGQKAVAYAAVEKPKESVRWAVKSLRLTLAERRAYVALVIASGAVSADRVVAWANRRGRGI